MGNITYPQDITVDDILKWRDIITLNAKPITWNGYVRHMRSLYNFGMETGLVNLPKNPFLKVSLKTGKEKRKLLSKDQINKLDKLFMNDGRLPRILYPKWFIICLINTFRYTGIRRSQLVKLRLKDIDLNNKVIVIPSHINKNHNYHEIPISDKLFPHLQNLINHMRALKRSNNDQAFNLNVISKYTQYKNRDMTIDQVSHIFSVISKIIGFKISSHRFRHTITTNLMKNVNNVYQVKQLLGHSDIKVTLSYIEYTPDMIRDCVNSL